jgi:hypothetical protein
MNDPRACTPGQHPFACTRDNGRPCLACREAYAYAFAREQRLPRSWLRRELRLIRAGRQA